MRYLGTRISIGVVWAMIPLTLVSALPRMGCICANGQYKIFCERNGGGARPQCKAAASQATEAVGCSCCHRHGHAVAKSKANKAVETRNHEASKAAAPRACCGNVADCGGRAPHLTDGERCCKPVLSAPLLPPVVSADVVSIDFAQLALIPVIDLPSMPLVCAGLVAAREHVLPPIDRVIVNRVFLI